MMKRETGLGMMMREETGNDEGRDWKYARD